MAASYTIAEAHRESVTMAAVLRRLEREVAATYSQVEAIILADPDDDAGVAAVCFAVNGVQEAQRALLNSAAILERAFLPSGGLQ